MPLTNVRYAIRSLRRSPTFAAAAVLTLALGLGANTAVFSVVDAALLRPLPYGDPDRLVSVRDVNRNGSGGGVMLDKLTSYRAARSFEGLASFNRMSRTLTGSGEPEQVLGENVTVNLFTVVGVHPAIGRGFRPGDDVPAGEHVVVLTDGFWRRRFGADPSILGRTLVLNDVRHTVVGVMPRTFEPLTQPGSGFRIDFLVPEPVADASVIVRQVSIVGRLAPGVTQAQAQSELQGLSSDRVLSPIVTPIRDNFLRGNLRRSLGVMFGAVALVLLVACVNFGNLLIVHTIGLQREIATRIALGAARGEIALDLAARGLVLGGLGGILGLGGGVWIRTALVALAPRTIPGLDQAALNGRVLAFTLISSLVSGIAASLLPMLHFSHLDLAASVAGSGRSATGTRAAMRWRGILMSIEIAAAVVLTVGAGLLIQSQAALNRVELGFRTDGVLMFTVRLPETRYPDQPARLAFFEALEPQLAALGGVQAVALTDAFPARGGRRTDVTVPGGVTLRADTQLASPGYFTALRIRLQRGRTFGRARSRRRRTGRDRQRGVCEPGVRRPRSDRPADRVVPLAVARHHRRRRRRRTARRSCRGAGGAGVHSCRPDRELRRTARGSRHPRQPRSDDARARHPADRRGVGSESAHHPRAAAGRGDGGSHGAAAIQHAAAGRARAARGGAGAGRRVWRGRSHRRAAKKGNRHPHRARGPQPSCARERRRADARMGIGRRRRRPDRRSTQDRRF